jgi:hypothetical protein
MTANSLTAELWAMATLPASARDMFGDTLGSLSAVAIDPQTWTQKRGAWSATVFTLPDRGFNTPTKDEYSDYPGRVHAFTLRIGEKGDARLEYPRSQYLRDADGAQTTGLDPGKATKQLFKQTLPAGDRGLGKSVPRRLSLDAEGLARQADGSFYVSDEFACAIYFFDASAQMRGVILPPPSIAPRKRKRPHFTSHDRDPPDTGRQPNDGFEGISLSPDGKTLFALMQSPLVQDLCDGAEGERYVRLLTFDVSRDPCPKKPNGHFVVELPLFDGGDGPRAPETNCVLALPGGEFLVLARDGGGYGDRKGKDGTARPIQFKRVLRGRLRADANLAGSNFDQDVKSIWRKRKRDPEISPLSLETAIDLCDESALNRVGLSVRPDKRGYEQLSAKWEGLCLTPPLKKGRLERFLLVSNDNDFLTRDGMMPDRAYDAGIDNPNRMLIYRVIIP